MPRLFGVGCRGIAARCGVGGTGGRWRGAFLGSFGVAVGAGVVVKVICAGERACRGKKRVVAAKRGMRGIGLWPMRGWCFSPSGRHRTAVAGRFFWLGWG